VTVKFSAVDDSPVKKKKKKRKKNRPNYAEIKRIGLLCKLNFYIHAEKYLKKKERKKEKKI
jgi:hypothetical protein